MISPVKSWVRTSPYGWRNLNGKRQFHGGIDLVSGAGDRTVRAMADGEVVLDYDSYQDARRWTYPPDSGGNMVILKTKIRGKFYFIRYLHLSENIVSKGQKIKQGAVLGHYADVGYSFGAHLHIDAYDGKWKPVDITKFCTFIRVKK
jgi:murein DD-endopeptidase MepM/ murein hydrolase activator NlpD